LYEGHVLDQGLRARAGVDVVAVKQINSIFFFHNFFVEKKKKKKKKKKIDN